MTAALAWNLVQNLSRASSPTLEEPPSITNPTIAATLTKQKDNSAALSRKHIEASIRLANDAVAEEDDTEYSYDCWFNSLDYLINALPRDTSSMDRDRRLALRNKVMRALAKLSNDDDPAIPPPQEDTTWRQKLSPRTQMKDPTSNVVLANCSCGRKVAVTIPDDQFGMPRTWSEVCVATVVTLAVWIRDSPLPYLIGQAITGLARLVVLFDKQYGIHHYLIQFATSFLQFLIDLGAARTLFALIQSICDILMKAAVAFAKAESYKAPPQPMQTTPDPNLSYAAAAAPASISPPRASRSNTILSRPRLLTTRASFDSLGLTARRTKTSPHKRTSSFSEQELAGRKSGKLPGSIPESPRLSSSSETTLPPAYELHKVAATEEEVAQGWTGAWRGKIAGKR